MRKILLGFLVLALIAGLLLAARTVDQMAVAYVTGQRRVEGRSFFGQPVPQEGPVPGYASLGRTRPSQDPPGMRITRPGETARTLGLQEGDVVTSVAGKFYDSSRELMSDLIRNYQAGQSVDITAVTPGQGPRTLSMTLRAFIRHPGDVGLPYQDVEIQSGSGYRLRGWFVPPPPHSDGRMGIFVHGAKSSRFQALEHGGDQWYRRGYGLLMMDLSGRGSSEGEYVTYTVNERLDVAAMLDWARGQTGVDPERIVVFGTSNGAASAIYAAAGDGTLAALALDAPYGDLWDAASAMLSSRGGSPLLRHPLFLAVRWRTGADLGSVRPASVMEEIKAPVLFLHGDADRQVPLSHSQQMHAARMAAGLPSEIWVLPGGEHGFDNYPTEEVFWGRILDFFDRALGGAGPQPEVPS